MPYRFGTRTASIAYHLVPNLILYATSVGNRIGYARRIAVALVFSTGIFLMSAAFTLNFAIARRFSYFFIECNTSMMRFFLGAVILGCIFSIILYIIRRNPTQFLLRCWRFIVFIPLLGTLITIVGSQVGLTGRITLPSLRLHITEEHQAAKSENQSPRPMGDVLERVQPAHTEPIGWLTITYGWLLLALAIYHYLTHLASVHQNRMLLELIRSNISHEFYYVYNPEVPENCPIHDKASFEIPIEHNRSLQLQDIYNFYKYVGIRHNVDPQKMPGLYISIRKKDKSPYVLMEDGVIILPFSVGAWLTIEQQKDQGFVERFFYFLLGHELNHYRLRKRYAISFFDYENTKLLTSILLPFMWWFMHVTLGVRLHDIAEEAACDAEARGHIPELKDKEMKEVLAGMKTYSDNLNAG